MKTCKCGNEFEPIRLRNSTIYTKRCTKCLSKKGAEMEHKRIKDEVKDRGYYEKKLEKTVNAICRVIDFGQRCISCNSLGNQAGHRHSVGSNRSLRYNLHNTHIQEYACNVEKSGNYSNYDLGLVKQYGIKYQQYVQFNLVALYPEIKLSLVELRDAYKRANQCLLTIKKIQAMYPPDERLYLRNFANETIGIYKHKYINK